MRRSHKGLFRPTHPEKYLGNARNIVYRSSWEFRFFRYCDATPGVLKWASEEFNIPYLSPVDGHAHRYFPDVYAQILSPSGVIKHYVIEIKPKAQCQPPKQPKRKTNRYLTEAMTYAINQAKWDAATHYCKQRSWEFLVITEDHLFGKLT